MSWITVRLGDVVTLKRGYDLPQIRRQDGEIPVVSSSGITGYHNEKKVTAPGVVTGRYGTLGEVFYLEQDFWPLNTALYVQDFKCNQPRFIAYFLKNELANIQSDKAAVPGVNRNDLHDRAVNIPDYETQQRIAATLSAYDDLIENNLRRMKLLEEAARLLYQEWFVRLRFPGREHTPVINCVLQGWEQKILGECVKLNYGKGLRADERVDGPFPVYGSSGIIGTHERPLAPGPGIIVGRKGNVGSIFWSSQDFYPIDTVYYINPEASNLYLYYALRHMHFINTDVAVPGLNREFAYTRPLLVPSERILRQFLEIVSPLHDQIDKLDEMNQKLRTARDMSLPRLMSGELAV